MSSHSIINIKNDLSETEELLKKNTNKIVARENKLDALEQKTDNLVKQSLKFKIKSKTAKCTIFIQNNYCIIVTISSFVILFIIVLLLNIYDGEHKK